MFSESAPASPVDRVSAGGETMGLWQIDADTLAGGRFIVSPLAETTSCLLALDRGSPAYQGEYRSYLRAHPVTAALIKAAHGRRWIADFLTPTPTGQTGLTFADELSVIRAASPAQALADLEMSSLGPVPPELHRQDLPELMADALTWVWTQTVQPSWHRRRRVLEADVLSRTARLGTGGGGGGAGHDGARGGGGGGGRPPVKSPGLP